MKNVLPQNVKKSLHTDQNKIDLLLKPYYLSLQNITDTKL
jgi:hypothetical protein